MQFPQFAADFRRSFEEGHLPPTCGRADGGGQSADAGPYDGDRAHFPRWSAARSKQMRNQVVKRSGSAAISVRTDPNVA